MDLNIHHRRLAKIYEAVGGSRTKGFVLTQVLADEGVSDEEAWVEAEYMEGEGWIEMIADNGPPFANLTHSGVKAAQEYISRPLIGSPVRQSTASNDNFSGLTLQQWAGAPDSKATVALVFTDIINSTEIGGAMGDDKWIPILTKHFKRARSLRDQYNGYLIKVIGDACMMAFRTTVEAFHFAVDFFVDTGDPLINIRAGIHFGRVWIMDNDIYGSMVNLTSRIQSSVTKTGIALSDAAAKDIQGVLGKNPDVRFASGAIELKGFGQQTVWRVRTIPMVQAERARLS